MPQHSPRDRDGPTASMRARRMHALTDRQPSLGSLLKGLSENAGAVGLVLGLVLSTLSLYDVLVRKPEADRLSAIAQFNQTVNSAAKTRQEVLQLARTGDSAQRLSVAAMATPRILNDIATATALLPTLKDQDVGIPQLLILISESLTAGDTASADKFVKRAVGKKDVTPMLAAEALRAQGRYQFFIGEPASARDSYLRGLRMLGDSVPARGAKAFHLADLIGMQVAFSSCEHVAADLQSFRDLIAMPGVTTDMRSELVASVNAQLNQFSGQKCSGIAAIAPEGPAR